MESVLSTALRYVNTLFCDGVITDEVRARLTRNLESVDRMGIVTGKSMAYQDILDNIPEDQKRYYACNKLNMRP